ncbi:hypothetical protein GCM10022249_02600 [Enteractinococcus coprophilus]
MLTGPFAVIAKAIGASVIVSTLSALAAAFTLNTDLIKPARGNPCRPTGGESQCRTNNRDVQKITKPGIPISIRASPAMPT